ncbi:MAG TPA: PKD domain-containing protein [Verrucomicrobiae bacterium]|nr:PKD domain-containing protein [Verrucomicrobiae bacterium]
MNSSVVARLLLNSAVAQLADLDGRLAGAHIYCQLPIVKLEIGNWKLLGWVILVGLVGLMSSPTEAAVLRVPEDYPGIQRAIDASRNGDTVLVSPGFYNENINFKHRAITLSGTNPSDPTVVSNTVIQAVGKSSAVTFATGEMTNSILTGFTITGGYGTSNGVAGATIYYGAGIYCFRSSPTIVGNIITGNVGPTEPNLSGYGAGICCIDSRAVITRNLITANSGYAGGGILMSLGRAKVANNVIAGNSAVIGGGVVMLQGGQLANNTLVGNGAQFAGNAYAGSDSSGQCLLTGNIIGNATTGGGLFFEEQDRLTQTTFNDVWNNVGGDYSEDANRTGVDGNISQDPQFVDATIGDYHLRDVSPCINAGDPGFQPGPDETDFYGRSRLYARRVDIGATEYSDNFRPLADAGPDRVVAVTYLPYSITLDGSGSSDPNGAALSYHWQQLSGPSGSFTEATAAKPMFNVLELGTYVFALVVDNGRFSSFSDVVQVIAKNDAPTANAGADQAITDLSENTIITLDGSRSSDPENAVLRYHWQQIDGWKIQLSDPNAAQPTLLHPWPGLYLFALVVDDGMQQSEPDVVAVGIGPNHAPVADAGLPRYVAAGSVTLDGTGSYDPDGYGTLTYQWRQISGPTANLAGADTATPVLSGFIPRATNQTCVFELILSDGYLVSAPSTTRVTIVRNFGTNALQLANPPFDPAKPTIVAFGGGDCATGVGMTFGGVWEERANWLTVNSYGSPYFRYGDMLIVYLSNVAPNYRQSIQTIGFSTGNLPAMDAAWYINATYKDARYAANRVSLLDPVCGSLAFRVTPFLTNRIAGEQCWVDNYLSYDPNFPITPILAGALHVVCRPPRTHSYPVIRYSTSSPDYENDGLTAFAYLSLIGAGKNYQLNTASQKYYLAIDTNESVGFFNQPQFPGKILAPVQLTGPADGAILPPAGAVFGCEPVENAVRYQLLVGAAPDRVMDYAVLLDTPNPPAQTLATLPHQNAWWTVKAIDQFGSSIYADPRRIKLPENRPPIANPGSNQVVYAGLDGQAKVTLNALRSTDPDGDPLGFTWAWASGGRAYLSNAARITIELPIGSHTAQLMVNDGQMNSAIAELQITVVGPMQCVLKILPTQINLRSPRAEILAAIRFPPGVTGAKHNDNMALTIYPGGIPATRAWTVGTAAAQGVYGFFDTDQLTRELQNGPVTFTVVGTLPNGQVFHGSDTVRIRGKSEDL